MRKFDYDLIVIGSGAAGSAGALMAAAADLKVAIVEADRWGGSPLNYTDVPRAALFHATHLLQTSIAGSRFGISSKNLHYNYPTINSWKNVAMRRAGANDPKSLQDAGVACYHGRAHFLSPFEISVGQKRLSAKHSHLPIARKAALALRNMYLPMKTYMVMASTERMGDQGFQP